ncbi:protein shisa-5 isoform X2 [Ixodes scapularis]|uniref:Putative ww domain binding protein n=3 Tax=Ixodes TaxID=6944 RepID=A0A4D5RNV1_IXOSC|nr:protein shisa-5 isoform X2 [Ixodes scapularis]
MNLLVLVSVATVYLSSVVEEALAATCTREVYDITQYFTCPGPLDKRSAKYCCGSKKLRFCCDLEDYSEAIKSVGVVVGVIIVIIITLVVVVIVSCFCCSCCLLARRRQQRGQVLYGGPTGATTAPSTQPVVSSGAYPQQAYPVQQMVSYPVQPPAPAGAPGAPGFGYYASPYGNPPPYTDTAMPVQQPPPMQQPPYNPGYPAK